MLHLESQRPVCVWGYPWFPSAHPLRVYIGRGTRTESLIMRKVCFCASPEVSRSLPHPPFPETDADTEWNIIEGLLSRKDCAYEPPPPTPTASCFLILWEGPLYLVLLCTCQEKWMRSPSVFWKYRYDRRKCCITATVRKNHAREQFLLSRTKTPQKQKRWIESPESGWELRSFWGALVRWQVAERSVSPHSPNPRSPLIQLLLTNLSHFSFFFFCFVY